MSLRFATDLYTWLPALVAALASGAILLEGWARRRALARLGDLGQLGRMMATLSPWRRRTRAVLFVLGLTLVAVALSRPQRETSVTFTKRGVDVVVAMDMSKSMLARDVYPDRLTRMTEEVEQMLDKLESDRVAVVVFAGGAAEFPLSEDTEAARSLFRSLTNCPRDVQSRWPTWCAPRALAPGSNLAEGILAARCVLRQDLRDDPGCSRIGGHGRGGAPLSYDDTDAEPAVDPDELADRARAMVVFTDGGDSSEEARAQVQRAVELGIHVFIVGVGTLEGELIPAYDDEGRDIGWKKSEDGKSFVHTRLDQAQLVDLAEIAGGEGHYFWLDPQRFDVKEVVDRLRRLKQGDLGGQLEKEWTDIYEWPLFAGFMLLLIEATLSERRRRVLYPEEQRS